LLHKIDALLYSVVTSKRGNVRNGLVELVELVESVIRRLIH